MTIHELVAVFRRWLYLPDPGPVVVTLAAYVANRLPGDPVWLLLVGPPSSGKTELLNSLSGLKDAYSVSTFTEAGLLSGSTSRRPDATGGLLVELGKSGVIVCKDFGSVLSESSETRAGILAALREIYDGAWCRRLGTGGGLKLAWTGEAGLLAGVTETIDRHAATMGALGERFLLYRLPALDDEGRLEQGRRAGANTGHQVAMRHELARAVASFVGGASLLPTAEAVSSEATEQLVLLADLATRCRSPVERDARDREIELVPQPEAIGRMQAVLVQLLRGLWAIGVSDPEARRMLGKVALDSIPKNRRLVIEHFVSHGSNVYWATADVADALGIPTGVIGRTLADLAAHGIVLRHAQGGGQHRWTPSEWLLARCDEL